MSTQFRRQDGTRGVRATGKGAGTGFVNLGSDAARNGIPDRPTLAPTPAPAAPTSDDALTRMHAKAVAARNKQQTTTDPDTAAPTVSDDTALRMVREPEANPLTPDLETIAAVAADFSTATGVTPEQALAQAQRLDAIASVLAHASVTGDSATSAGARKELHDFIATMPTDAACTAFDELENIEPENLPHTPGIYIITGEDAHYVGLSNDVHTRFHIPEYGHLSYNNKCRSQYIINDGNFELRVIPFTTPTSSDTYHHELAKAEIVTYARLAATGKYVNNSISTLGKVGNSVGTPVVTCSLEDGSYEFYESAAAAQRRYGGAISAILGGYQRTTSGVAARFATPAEQEQLLESLDRRGRVTGVEVAQAVASQRSDFALTDNTRTAKLSWSAGALPDESRAQLAKYSRGSYNKNNPASGYNAVSYNSGANAWGARVKTGSGPKDFVGKTFATPSEAALWRETYVAENNLQSYNTGRYASNADLLNAQNIVDTPLTGWADTAPGTAPAA